jgi:hypothetical protein
MEVLNGGGKLAPFKSAEWQKILPPAGWVGKMPAVRPSDIRHPTNDVGDATLSRVK